MLFRSLDDSIYRLNVDIINDEVHNVQSVDTDKQTVDKNIEDQQIANIVTVDKNNDNNSKHSNKNKTHGKKCRLRKRLSNPKISAKDISNYISDLRS